MHQNVKIRRKRLGTNRDALVVDTHERLVSSHTRQAAGQSILIVINLRDRKINHRVGMKLS
jgi:hypothetical protein